MKLHHCAYRISKGYSHLMQEFCEFLGARLIWEGEGQGREIIMQFAGEFRIQFSEIGESPVVSKNKQEAHIAIHSKDPETDLRKVERWFNKRSVKTKTGRWSDSELWLDCPSVFINFAIEVFEIS